MLYKARLCVSCEESACWLGWWLSRDFSLHRIPVMIVSIDGVPSLWEGRRAHVFLLRQTAASLVSVPPIPAGRKALSPPDWRLTSSPDSILHPSTQCVPSAVCRAQRVLLFRTNLRHVSTVLYETLQCHCGRPLPHSSVQWETKVCFSSCCGFKFASRTKERDRGMAVVQRSCAIL